MQDRGWSRSDNSLGNHKRIRRRCFAHRGIARALRRDPSSADAFPQDVAELMSYFSEPSPGQAVRAVPGAGLDVLRARLAEATFGRLLELGDVEPVVTRARHRTALERALGEVEAFAAARERGVDAAATATHLRAAVGALDDLVSGYCQALIPALPGEDCQNDAHCTARQDGSDTCDVAHGLCYKKAALPGDACARDTECMLGGVCSMGPRFAGGYCQTFGCDPNATTGVDACGGTHSTCATRGGPDEPIGACYESCTTATPCSRAAAQYRCEPATSGAPANICLVTTGA